MNKTLQDVLLHNNKQLQGGKQVITHYFSVLFPCIQGNRQKYESSLTAF